MNNPKRETLKNSIIIDSWLNKAMSVPEAIEEYKKLISKRELASNLFEIQQDLKFKHARKQQTGHIPSDEVFNLNNYDFKYKIHFFSDQDFTSGEREEFSAEIKENFPRLILDFLA